jgi:hypothetical protein
MLCLLGSESTDSRWQSLACQQHPSWPSFSSALGGWALESTLPDHRALEAKFLARQDDPRKGPTCGRRSGWLAHEFRVPTLLRCPCQYSRNIKTWKPKQIYRKNQRGTDLRADGASSSVGVEDFLLSTRRFFSGWYRKLGRAEIFFVNISFPLALIWRSSMRRRDGVSRVGRLI